MFDAFGNALEGYKVTFEIIGQGTTTDGTIDTYHPYAHFELPAHDFDGQLAGLGDRNPNLNANPLWNRLVDLAGTADDYVSDDDYAWGYTLNGQINDVTDLGQRGSRRPRP